MKPSVFFEMGPPAPPLLYDFFENGMRIALSNKLINRIHFTSTVQKYL